MSLWDARPVPSRVLGLVHTALALQSETVGATTELDEEAASDEEKKESVSAGRFARDDLGRLVAPEVLTHRVDGGDVDTFPTTFNECVRLGLFIARGEEFAVDEMVRQATMKSGSQRTALAGISALDALTDSVRRQILRRLADGVDPEFCRLLAWSLMQSGGVYPLDSDKAERLSLEQDPARSAVGFNTVRYGSFLYWTRFLGFGFLHSLSGRDCLQPDPTAAFERQMPEWFGREDGRTLFPLPEFMAWVEQCFPWAENGAIVRAVRQDLAEPPARPEKTLNDATALALNRLERQKVVRLVRQSDAAEVFTLAWGGPRREASHIEYLAKGGSR